MCGWRAGVDAACVIRFIPRPRIGVICAVWLKASAGAVLLVAWACTAKYVDDVL